MCSVWHSRYPDLFCCADLGVYRYELSVAIPLETRILRVTVMTLSGLPSLLAVAGLLGFAFVVMLLPY